MQTTELFPRSLAESGKALTVVVKDLLSEWSHLRIHASGEKSSRLMHTVAGIISIYRGHKRFRFLQRVGIKSV